MEKTSGLHREGYFVLHFWKTGNIVLVFFFSLYHILLYSLSLRHLFLAFPLWLLFPVSIVFVVVIAPSYYNQWSLTDARQWFFNDIGIVVLTLNVLCCRFFINCLFHRQWCEFRTCHRQKAGWLADTHGVILQQKIFWIFDGFTPFICHKFCW